MEDVALIVLVGLLIIVSALNYFLNQRRDDKRWQELCQKRLADLTYAEKLWLDKNYKRE